MGDIASIISRPIIIYKYKEEYIKPHIFGVLNDVISNYINNSMNRFPLAFDFEGAFYKAFHIGRK